MLQVIPQMVVEAEINDGKIRIKCNRDDVTKLVEILQLNNLKSLTVTNHDWTRWQPYGPIENEKPV